MQGQLRKEDLTVHVETECGHCHSPLHLDIDSDLSYRVREAEATPLIFVPSVNMKKLNDPSIIDEF